MGMIFLTSFEYIGQRYDRIPEKSELAEKDIVSLLVEGNGIKYNLFFQGNHEVARTG